MIETSVLNSTTTVQTNEAGACASACAPVDKHIPDKTWEQFEACEQCHGHAQIDETPDGDLICHVCHCKLPRPST
jgi:hypothetical protein